MKEFVITLKLSISEVGSDSMKQDQINEDYKKFGIPQHAVPYYRNADEFATNIKKCSLLKNVDVCYTSNSTYEKGFRPVGRER